MLKCYRFVLIAGILAFFFFATMPLAFSEEENESGIWASFEETFSPRLDINVRSAYYYEDSDLEPNDFHLAGNATLQFSKDLFSGLTLRIDPRFNFDTLSTSGTQLLIEDREGRPTFTFNEALIVYYGETIEIEAGKKIYSWKVADGFSPLDTLNPVDIIELMDSEKIGVPSISALKMFEALEFQVVFLPFFVPDRQPDDSSRWTSDDPEARANFKARFGMEPVIVDAGRALADDKLDKMSIAGRLSSSSLITGWDLAFVYRYGYSTRGVIRNDINLLTLPIVQQTTEYPAYNLYGFSFSTTAGDFELHGEAGFHDSRDNLKDEDYLSYIAGFNYTFYDWFSGFVEETRVVTEYAAEEVITKRDTGSSFSDNGVSRGLTNDIIGSIEFKFSEDHSFTTSYIYNFSDEDSVLDIKVESQLNDYLEIIYGYQMLSGDEGTFFGQWDKNDKVFLRLSIKY